MSIVISWLSIPGIILVGAGLLKLTLQYSSSKPLFMGISSIFFSAICFIAQTLLDRNLIITTLNDELFWRLGITFGLLYAFAFLFSSLSAVILFDRQKNKLHLPLLFEYVTPEMDKYRSGKLSETILTQPDLKIISAATNGMTQTLKIEYTGGDRTETPSTLVDRLNQFAAFIPKQS